MVSFFITNNIFLHIGKKGISCQGKVVNIELPDSVGMFQQMSHHMSGEIHSASFLQVFKKSIEFFFEIKIYTVFYGLKVLFVTSIGVVRI